ncbi:hypothetical protein PMAYCL1PPCAC_05749, partial [Pristionchus mayeri]
LRYHHERLDYDRNHTGLAHFPSHPKGREALTSGSHSAAKVVHRSLRSDVRPSGLRVHSIRHRHRFHRTR